MATHKSAEKRARSSAKKNQNNSQYISAVRTTVKKFRLALAAGQDGETVQNLFRSAQEMLAKAASKGLLHRNNASRRISRLAHALASASAAKAAGTAAPSTKSAPKKKSVAAAPKAAAPKKAATAAPKKAAAKPATKKKK